MKMIVLSVLLVGVSGLRVYAQRPDASVARVDPARTEGAIIGGLRWLAERQIQEGSDAGSWPVAIANYRPAIASLAGLAFLANGHLPGDSGPYGELLAKTLKYVMGTMANDGYLGQGDRSGMYIHAISTLFGLSCLGMQQDETVEPELADWCRRSLESIIRAQQVKKEAVAQGGWRYDPYTSDSDVSVSCWQLLVLHSARQAGFNVDPPVFNSALAYLNRSFLPAKAKSGEKQGEPAGGYMYLPGVSREPKPSSTALVVFIQSLFNAMPEKRTRESLVYLRRYPPSWGGAQYGGFFYFSAFYMVQGMFQIGGVEWETFGSSMAKVLLDHQAGDGSWPYPPDNNPPAQLRGTGPAYPVAMAVLMLSLDKQYLPMYQRQSQLYDAGSSVSGEEPVVAEVTSPVKTIPVGGTPAGGKTDDFSMVPPSAMLPPPIPAADVGLNVGGWNDGGGTDDYEEDYEGRKNGFLF